MKNFIKNILVAVAVLIVLWVAIDLFLRPAPYIMPSISDVCDIMLKRWGLLVEHSYITFIEVILGFLIANTLSISVALALIFVPKAENVTLSMAVALKTIPIIAVAPLLVLWFGAGIWSKVAAVITVCFLPSLINVTTGVKQIDNRVKDLAKLYNASRIQTVRYFILPGLKPYILSALKSSSTLAVVGALVGEFISANQGLGYLIISSYYSLNIALVFACIIFVSVFGIALYYGVDYLGFRLKH